MKHGSSATMTSDAWHVSRPFYVWRPYAFLVSVHAARRHLLLCGFVPRIHPASGGRDPMAARKTMGTTHGMTAARQQRNRNQRRLHPRTDRYPQSFQTLSLVRRRIVQLQTTACSWGHFFLMRQLGSVLSLQWSPFKFELNPWNQHTTYLGVARHRALGLG